MSFILPRLVVPSELAHRVSWYGPAWQSPAGTLTFIGPVKVPLERLPDVFEDMTALSLEWLQTHPGAPELVQSTFYELEPPGENDYLALPVSLGLYDQEYTAATGHRPFVDCEDLSIGDSAEERYRGNWMARPDVIHVSPSMLHVVTNLGPGRPMRDVSRNLITLFPGNKGRPWNPSH